MSMILCVSLPAFYRATEYDSHAITHFSSRSKVRRGTKDFFWTGCTGSLGFFLRRFLAHSLLVQRFTKTFSICHFERSKKSCS